MAGLSPDWYVILIDAHPQHDWLLGAVEKRLHEELALLHVTLNEAKNRIVDLAEEKASDLWALTSTGCTHARANGRRTVPRE